MNFVVTKNEIKQAAELLKKGQLIAFPTETVYGLGADATNPEAIAKIFAAKGRPADHPVIVHLPGMDHIRSWARDINSVARKLAQHFWPGPLTLILPCAENVSSLITGGQKTIGLRVPKHPIAQQLLQMFGGAIAAPSANRFGHVSPTQAVHVKQELGGAVTVILEGGPCECGIESTIIDCSGEKTVILRPGVITASAISDLLQQPVTIAEKTTMRAPGTLATHYAPQTPLQLISEKQLMEKIMVLLKEKKSLVVLSRKQALMTAPPLHWGTMPTDPQFYAHELYTQLRAADALHCNYILVEDVPLTEEWTAIRDRLQKAAYLL